MRKMITILVLIASFGCNSSNDNESFSKPIIKNEYQYSRINLTVKSKFDYDVGIMYGFSYFNVKELTAEDSIVKLINKTIIDSLHQFEIFEMFATSRSTVDTIIGRIVLNELNKNNIELNDNNVELRDVSFPLDYVEELQAKKKLLEEELIENKNLTDREIKSIEREIMGLDSQITYGG